MKNTFRGVCGKREKEVRNQWFTEECHLRKGNLNNCLSFENRKRQIRPTNYKTIKVKRNIAK